MKHFRVVIIFFLFILPLTSFAQAEKKSQLIRNFVSCLIGDFTEGTIKGLDSEQTTLRLHHVYLETWENTDSTAWVYEEINYLKNEENGFRQMVLKIQLLDSGIIKVSNFLIEKPWLFKNAYSNPSLMMQLNPDYIKPESSCAVLYKLTKHEYVGSTAKGGCPNHFHNAVQYSSMAVLTSSSYKFWDRGWDAAGTQVWGKENAGYEFIRTVVMQEAPASKLNSDVPATD